MFLFFHPDTVIEKATPEVHYLMPCTWTCSCDKNKKVWKGWVAEIHGKIYHIEGDRKDGKPNPKWMGEIMFNPNKK